MMGSTPVQQDTVVQLSGVLINGRTPASHLEYWVRGPMDGERRTKLEDDDPELLAGAIST